MNTEALAILITYQQKRAVYEFSVFIYYNITIQSSFFIYTEQLKCKSSFMSL